MLSFRSGVRIYTSTEPTDMRPRAAVGDLFPGRYATVNLDFQADRERSELEGTLPVRHALCFFLL